jgi:hypothetical protein
MLGLDGDLIVVHGLEIAAATVRHDLNTVFTLLIFAF